MNVPKDLKHAYANFFQKTEAGQYYMAELNRQIEDCHREAENKPELSRDHVQRAKGVRLGIDHINSVIGGVKK